MILSLGSLSLSSDIDDLELTIPTDGLVLYTCVKKTIATNAATSILDWSIPSTFTGDAAFTFRGMGAAYGQSSTSDNKASAIRFIACGSRFSNTLYPGTTTITNNYINNEDQAPAASIGVNGSQFQLKITQSTTNQYVWAVAILIVGVKV